MYVCLRQTLCKKQQKTLKIAEALNSKQLSSAPDNEVLENIHTKYTTTTTKLKINKRQSEKCETHTWKHRTKRKWAINETDDNTTKKKKRLPLHANWMKNSYKFKTAVRNVCPYRWELKYRGYGKLIFLEPYKCLKSNSS